MKQFNLPLSLPKLGSKLLLLFFILLFSKSLYAQEIIKTIVLSDCGEPIETKAEVLTFVLENEDLDEITICRIFQSFKRLSANEQTELLASLVHAAWRASQESHLAKAIKIRHLSARINHTIGNKELLAKDLYPLSALNRDLGNLVEAFRYATYGLAVSQESNLPEDVFMFNINLSGLSVKIDDCLSANKYLDAAKIYLAKAANKKNADSVAKAALNNFNYYYSLSFARLCNGDFGNAKNYIDTALTIAIESNVLSNISNAYLHRSACYPEGMDMEVRLSDLNKALEIYTSENKPKQEAMTYSAMGKLYMEQAELRKGESFLMKGLALSKKVKDRTNIYKTYQSLEGLHYKKNDLDEAYKYRRLHDAIFHEMYGNRNLKRIFSIEKEMSEELIKGEFVKQEREQKIKTLELSKANQQKTFLISILSLVLLFFSILWYRYRKYQKRQKEHLKDKMEKKIAQFEIQSLRAQMNPHFIFNSLNSIKSYIANKESRTATRYLNKFSRLIRMILNNSKQDKVTLEEEIKALKLYLDIEQLRLDNKFEFEINCPSHLYGHLIPPLIFQPYVENAIWHGLLKKETNRFLKIKIKQSGELLMISIRDNGVGRTFSKALKKTNVKHKSYGMNITKNRIALNNENENVKNVSIVDHADPQGEALGTEVLLTLITE